MYTFYNIKKEMSRKIFYKISPHPSLPKRDKEEEVPGAE